jgi:histone-lysine N-methyltransferase SETMAR
MDSVVLFHDDNTRPHMANRTAARMQSFGWEIMEHAPYSPDLAHSDYHMFGALKKFLAGQRFISGDDTKTAVWPRFCTQPTELYNSGISKPVVRWDKCLNGGGDYVEK